MQIMLNVPNEKAHFVMEVLNSFSFSTNAVEIPQNNNLELKKLLSNAGVSIVNDFSKEQNAKIKAADKLCGMFENTNISSYQFAQNKKLEIEKENRKLSKGI